MAVTRTVSVQLAQVLAQVNVGRLRFPVDSPQLAEFVAALDRVNRLAERSPGFVWRQDAANGHLHQADVLGDPLVVVNLSVWEAYEPLHAFVYRSLHGSFVRRRAEWFERIQAPSSVLWWIPAGHRPTVAEAIARLRRLRCHGPTPMAFAARCRFDPRGHREAPTRRVGSIRARAR